MRNLVKLVGIGLLALGLAACDNKDSQSVSADSSAQSSSQSVTLLDGKLSFSLPADMSDQSGKVGTQSDNMHVYSDSTGQKAVIVIVGNTSSDRLDALTKRLESEQRSRDPQLQVVTNKAIEVKGHKLQQFDSIISSKGQTTYSSIIIGNIGDRLLTMQITLPAGNQQQAQTTAQDIINTITIR